MKYKAAADWAVLGRKLRKDLGRVRNALPNVTSDEVKAYISSGKITVDSIELVEGDLAVQRYLELPSSSDGQYATNTDNDVVIRLDVQIHSHLQGEWLARELTNRVQKLRKKAGLQATDDINVFYSFEEGLGAELIAAINANHDIIKKTVGSLPVDAKERKEGSQVVIEEEQEIDDTKFRLCLSRS